MILQDLIALDGKLELYARDGRFLGLLSSDRTDPNSIVNLSTYGNVRSINSIYYKHGSYGGDYGRYSPYNRYCLYPPAIVFQQQPLGLVTKNKQILNKELTIVDPDVLLSIYTDLSDRVCLRNTSQLVTI
jgi:hypothetical protein